MDLAPHLHPLRRLLVARGSFRGSVALSGGGATRPGAHLAHRHTGLLGGAGAASPPTGITVTLSLSLVDATELCSRAEADRYLGAHPAHRHTGLLGGAGAAPLPTGITATLSLSG